jgi:hypothetical protein
VPSGRTQLPIASMGYRSATEIRGVSRGQVPGGSGGGVVKLPKLGGFTKTKNDEPHRVFLRDIALFFSF